MDARGMRQVELADRLGVPQSLVSRWIRGAWPAAYQLPGLADALGTSLDYLLRGTEASSRRGPSVDQAVAGAKALQAGRTAPAASKRGRG